MKTIDLYKESKAEYQRKMRANRMTKGLCYRCGKNPKSETSNKCQQCFDIAHEKWLLEHPIKEKLWSNTNEYSRYQYYKLKDKGICYTCRSKPVSNTITKRGTPSGQCERCIKARALKYTEIGKPRHLELKKAAFEAYGGCFCKCCQEYRFCFLTIDHIKRDGAAHRREIGRGADGIYSWLKRNNYPEGFRVLCFNCNSGRELNNGICPHEQERAATT